MPKDMASLKGCIDCKRPSYGERCRKCRNAFVRKHPEFGSSYVDGSSINKKCVVCGRRVVSRRRKSITCKSCCQLGHNVSLKTRQKIRVKNLGNSNFLGRKHTRKTKEIMRKNRVKYMLTHKRSLKDTNIEIIIKKELRKMDIKFKQSYCISNHIVDFFLPQHNLVIECDGKYWHNLPKQRIKDKRHNRLVKGLCYKLLRLKEKEILNKLPLCVRKIKNRLWEKI